MANKKKITNSDLAERVSELQKEESYTVKIPAYVMAYIQRGWSAELKKYKAAFSPEVAIQAIVRVEANRILQEELKLENV